MGGNENPKQNLLFQNKWQNCATSNIIMRPFIVFRAIGFYARGHRGTHSQTHARKAEDDKATV